MDNDRWPPLIWATSHVAGNLDVFGYLMAIDVVRSNLNLLSKDGAALHFGSHQGDVKALKAALNNDADIDSPGQAHVGTLILEAILGQSDAVFQLSLEKGAQLRRPFGLVHMPILAACFKGSPRSRHIPASRSQRIGRHRRLLAEKTFHLACYNSIKVLEQLNPPEDDFAARDGVGREPLHYAWLSNRCSPVLRGGDCYRPSEDPCQIR